MRWNKSRSTRGVGADGVHTKLKLAVSTKGDLHIPPGSGRRHCSVYLGHRVDQLMSVDSKLQEAIGLR